MTAFVAVPFAEQAAFPECVLPGCRGIAERPGEPCADCVKAFGPMLIRNPASERITAAAVAERDIAVIEAVRRQLATRTSAPPEPERKRSQRCWCCDEVHTCTRTDRGLWECDACAEATP